MNSPTYELFRRAILEEKQVHCTYAGHRREVCAIIIGHSDGAEKVLTFQFGGRSSRPLPPSGAWRCFAIADVHDATLHDGPWREGDRHRKRQTCVDEVDLDINIHVRRRR